MKARRRLWQSDLFLFKARPRLRMSLEWERPADETQYRNELRWEGLIWADDWREQFGDDLMQYPVIHQDLRDLEQIVPTFFEIRQTAYYHRNRFFLYTWIFAWGAFLVVVFSGLAAVLAAQDSSFSQPVSQLTFTFGSIAALSGVVVIFTTGLSNRRGESQKRWVRARRLTEELRTAYFKYLSHQYPYDGEDRFQKLRETLLNIRLEEQEKATVSGLTRSQGQQTREPHAPPDLPVLLRLYQKNRVEPQLSFYKFRVRETELNSDFTYTFSVLLLTVSFITALIGSINTQKYLLLAAAILPTLALVLTYFRQIYGWDRQSSLYRDTLAGYEQVQVLIDDSTNMDASELMHLYPKLVTESENVIASELSQWGQTEGASGKYQRPGILEVEPMFGPPPTQPQFECDIFMIMPFAEAFEPIYREQVIPVTREVSLMIKRGDDFFSEHAIMDEIWAGIYNAQLVICECTGRNPNVFYELGIAHTLGKPAIMITQQIEDTPFDLRHLRTIVYQNTPEGLPLLRQQLKEAITRLI